MKIHQMASAIRRNSSKLSQFELWLREIAEAVYNIEISTNQNIEQQSDSTQMSLFD